MADMGSDFMNFGNQDYILKLYESYRSDPNSIPEDWRAFFKGVDFASESNIGTSAVEGGDSSLLRIKLLHLVYQKFGHLKALSNPMLETQEEVDALRLSNLGFEESELGNLFPTDGLLSTKEAPLKEIIERLERVYAGKIGYEFAHIENDEVREALLSKILEGPYHLSDEETLMSVKELCKAKMLETFLHKKFLGAKRFSIEGGESLMPMLQVLFDEAAKEGNECGIIGMAHRGRLNVLCNLMNKPYEELFQEFDKQMLPALPKGAGDVKYHHGYRHMMQTLSGKEMELIMASNPSHLESVDPVMIGMTKGKMEAEGKKILPLMIHGDAAVAGQGVVYETMQLCNIDGYGVGGCIHLVINNQIGFTAVPEESRSTRYCTDLAKTFEAPVFHVNGEDIASCVFVAKLANYLTTHFGIEVFIDLICHRLYGHNEADEPMFTNPLEYKKIKARDDIFTAYKASLSGKESDIQSIEDEVHQKLSAAFEKAKELPKVEPPGLDCEPYCHLEQSKEEWFKAEPPKVSKETIDRIANEVSAVPADFHIHPKIQKVLDERKIALTSEENKIDFGCAETAAYATLLEEGVHIRISGQDSRRGTFAHRHAVIVDQEQKDTCSPLNNLSGAKANITVYNSPLSEYAVMGFEYGYSLTYPKSLVIWEAQFGDFANGAQIMIDQYISSTESKWDINSHLTLFLPHGHEGMGSEHTSARIERFLELSGTYNWRLVYPTSPAQMFHLLRSQAYLEPKKPLVVFTPKSMLRYPPSYAKPSDLTEGRFEEIIADPNTGAKRLLFCTGKMYYELEGEREKQNKGDVAIIRIEELYPLNTVKLKSVIDSFSSASEFIWVQEEHSNQGAYHYMLPFLREIVGDRGDITYIGRERSSVPASGYASLHKKQQQEILAKALG